MLYVLKSIDGKIFEGGNLQNSKWALIPNNFIISEIEYKFRGRKIFLKGYSAYNHIIVRAKAINSNYDSISEILLCAKKGEKVLRITFDLIKNKIKEDCIDFGKEYMNRPHMGWKRGIISNKCKRIIL